MFSINLRLRCPIHPRQCKSKLPPSFFARVNKGLTFLKAKYVLIHAFFFVFFFLHCLRIFFICWSASPSLQSFSPFFRKKEYSDSCLSHLVTNPSIASVILYHLYVCHYLSVTVCPSVRLFPLPVAAH